MVKKKNNNMAYYVPFEKHLNVHKLGLAWQNHAQELERKPYASIRAIEVSHCPEALNAVFDLARKQSDSILEIRETDSGFRKSFVILVGISKTKPKRIPREFEVLGRKEGKD